jgi:hypothetical protein
MIETGGNQAAVGPQEILNDEVIFLASTDEQKLQGLQSARV